MSETGRMWDLLQRAYEGGDAWRKALEAFDRGHRRLRQAMAGFADSRLVDVLPGRDYPFYVMLYGAIQHVLYHAGHVEMLMLAQGVHPQGSPPPRRAAKAVA